MASSPASLALGDLVKRPANLEVYKKIVADKTHPATLAYWKYLLLCFETPRPSTDYMEPDRFELLDKIRQGLSKAATALGAEVTQDTPGNLIIRREGKGKGVGKPWLCLQGHLDMVVSQNEGANHDFENDPIDVRFSSDDDIVDGWLKPVKATTLGADNGVALAAGLAILECATDHPPLELLFTSNEETSFSGAENLAPGTLKSKRLLNLDSEDEYQVVIGSAGIFEHQYKLPLTREAATVGLRNDGTAPISIKLCGLHGGHSGVDIHKGFGNANKLLARIMLHASEEHEVRLLEFSGGSGPTAIPREAYCVVLVSGETAKPFIEKVSKHFAEIREELKSVEPTMELKLGVCSESGADVDTKIASDGYESVPPPPSAFDAPSDVPPPPPAPFAKRKGLSMVQAWACARCEKCIAAAISAGADIGAAEATGKLVRDPSLGPLTPENTRKVWEFCCHVPSGVLRMSTDVEGLTESSVNFGVVTLMGGHLLAHVCVRSSLDSFLASYAKQLSAFGSMVGATNVENICPGAAWQPNTESALLQVLKSTHMEEFGREAAVVAIHAGLEPGMFMESHPGIDCCSIGPDVKNPHSPDERVNIASAERFLMWIIRVLETTAD